MELTLGPYLQHVAAVLVACLYISAGTPRGWSSPVVSRLATNETHVRCSEEQITWVSNVRSVGVVLFTLLLLFAGDLVGRKTLLLLSCVPSLTGWVLVALASSCEELIAARLLDSVTAAVLEMAPAIYISEVAREDVRGGFSVSSELVDVVGDLLVRCIAPHVSYTVLAVVPGVFPLVLFAVFLWMPESPYYHLLKGRPDLAEATLKRLRGVDDVGCELKRMHLFVDQNMVIPPDKSKICASLNSPRRSRSLLIGIVLVTATWCSGSYAAQEYKVLLFPANASDMLNDDFGETLLLVLQLVSSLLTSLCVDRLGRRPLLVVSLSGCAVSLAVGSLSLYWRSVPPWLPFAWSAAFKVAYSAGLSSVPCIVFAEIFPADVKLFCMSLLSLGSSVAAAASFQIVPKCVATLGTASVLWGGIALLTLCLGFVVTFVPETKCKPFAQIQDELNDGKWSCTSA